MVKVNNKQRGAVSLFVVIFAALLMTIITVSFVRIMLQDQQQASNNDLSQSAYDSAQVGVEDAKRALLKYQSICNSGGDCATAASGINSPTCNAAIEQYASATVDKSTGEINIQTDGTDTMNQAYTCVKINLNTNDYLGTLSTDESNIIPLSGVSSFDTIQISWFSPKAITKVLSTGSSMPLLNQTTWVGLPSILRAQLIQFNNTNIGFKLSNFNSGVKDNNDNGANTIFLYPSSLKTALGGAISQSLTLDGRRTSSSTGALQIATCSTKPEGEYACTAQIELPPISESKNNLFLNLKALYDGTDYQVMLFCKSASSDCSVDKESPVQFNAVQPEIDSTGRANNLFRRVETRVELTDINFPYPDAAVDITGDFCKGFSVTDSLADYNNGNVGQITDCTP
jgi:Tfp pilus assembly protein PilX